MLISFVGRLSRRKGVLDLIEAARQVVRAKPEPWRTVYGLNPMAGVVEGFRWALLGTNSAPGPIIPVSASAAIVILVTGTFYFRRMKRHLPTLSRRVALRS